MRVLREPLPNGDDWSAATIDQRRRIHLRDYWRVVVKHRAAIAATFLVVVASVTAIVFTMSPRYTAVVRAEIERRNPKIAPVHQVDQSEDDISYDQKYDYYQTRFKILQSRSIATRVIAELSLDTDERFLASGSDGLCSIVKERATRFFDSIFAGRNDTDDDSASKEDGVASRLIDRYLRMLAIAPVSNSRLVDISFTSGDRGLSAEIANRHLAEYIAADVERRLELNSHAKELLEHELAKARERVDTAEAAMNAYRKQHQVLGIDGEKSDIVSQRLSELNTQFTEAQGDRIRLEGEYQLIQRRDYESLPDVLSSSLIAGLKRNAAAVEAERAELEKKFTPEYPKMAAALARERQVKERLNQEVTKIVGGIESAYLASKSREESLRQELDRQRVAALAQKDFAADYGNLSRDVETARDVYRNLLQRLKDVDVAEEIKVSDVSVVDRATPPERPSYPRKLLSVAMGAAGGLGLGLMLAFFLEYMDDTLRTPLDVEERLALPTLGIVPTFDSPVASYGAYGYTAPPRKSLTPPRDHDAASETKPHSLPSEIVLCHRPLSIIAESYRTIRTKILLGSADVPIQIIMFTSAVPQEGKTVTAVNEALALVQMGGQVLIIDADIRRPRLHRLLLAPNGHGLSTYLAGQSTLADVIHEVPLNGIPRSVGNGGSVAQGRLFILPAGPLPPNPAELLGSRRMNDTLQALRKDFDYIVVDTPPVLPVADAVALAPLCDGVVYVVRGQQTPIPQVRQAQTDLESSRARILGVVLNDVDVSGGDYYGEYRYRRYASAVADEDMR